MPPYLHVVRSILVKGSTIANLRHAAGALVALTPPVMAITLTRLGGRWINPLFPDL